MNLDNLGGIFALALAEKLKADKKEAVKEFSTEAELIDFIKTIDSNMGDAIEQKQKESQSLSVELKLLVEQGTLQTYTFAELYDVLENPALVAVFVDEPAMHVTMEQGELVDNHGDIIPAFRNLITGAFVLTKDVEYIKSQQNKPKVKERLATSNEAMKALYEGNAIRIEYTLESGEAASIVLDRNNTNRISIPLEAMLNGVYYIIG